MDRIDEELDNAFDEWEEEGKKEVIRPLRVGLRCILLGHRPDKEFDLRLPCSFTHDGKQHIGGDGGVDMAWDIEAGPRLQWKMHRCIRCGTMYLDDPRKML